jgi:hypothetical protein
VRYYHIPHVPATLRQLIHAELNPNTEISISINDLLNRQINSVNVFSIHYKTSNSTGSLYAQGGNMKHVLIFVIVVSSGCSSQSYVERIQDRALERTTGKIFSRNEAKCPHIKNQCFDGNYEEWVLENGKKACV